jgi:hypothetical protein
MKTSVSRVAGASSAAVAPRPRRWVRIIGWLTALLLAGAAGVLAHALWA